MIVKYASIPTKIKNTSNPIIKLSLEICLDLLKNKSSEELSKDLEVEVRNIKTSSGSSYHSTIILGIRDRDGNSQDKFDLLEIENNKNFLRSKLTNSWNKLFEMHDRLQKVDK